MPKDEIDRLFEEMFGFPGSDAPPAPVEPPVAPRDPPSPETPPEPPEAVDDPPVAPVVAVPTRPPAAPLENHPDYLDCGHLDFTTPEQNEAARQEGFCCDAGKRKMPPNHRFTRGEYRVPVPERERRTVERIRMGGFPGLCCDEDGYYIGGKFNDCRRTGGPPCAVHATEKGS